MLRDRHLLLLAFLAVLLNCVNSTGEYILTQFVLDDASKQIALDPALDKGTLIAAFYGNFFFVVNALSLVVQVFLVSRIFRRLGVPSAILVLPIVVLFGYGLAAFLPVFAIIRAVKIVENSVDYSIMNTARHALYLPLPTAHQYEGKTTIDTFFWRFGDLAQAALIYVGHNWLAFGTAHFAMVNMLLAVVWIGVAAQIGKRYAGPVTRLKLNWRAAAVAVGSAAFAVIALAVPKDSRAAALPQAQELFGADEPLAIELSVNVRDLCRACSRGRRLCRVRPQLCRTSTPPAPRGASPCSFGRAANGERRRAIARCRRCSCRSTTRRLAAPYSKGRPCCRSRLTAAIHRPTSNTC